MIRRARYLSILPFALLATNDARAKDLESFHAYALEKPVVGATAPAGRRGFVASVDDKRNTPTFFFARTNQPVPQNLVGATRERLALHHLREHADMYGLSAKALQAAKVVMTHAPAGGGQIVVFRQYVAGVEVLDSDMKILMDRQGKLVAIGGALQPSAVPGAEKKLGAFALNSSAAVAKALEDLYGVKLSTSSFQQEKEKKAGYDIITLRSPIKTGTSTHEFVVPARAKKVYFPMPGTVVPAYYVEVQATSEGGDTPDAYAYVIGAKDGQLLRRVSLTEYDTYKYRVWADTTAPFTPKDGPIADYTPHPTGSPDNTAPQFILPSLITMEGFNKNPMGMADPWLPSGATETKGNNIDAYTDQTDCTAAATGACTATVAAANDGFTAGVDLRANVTAPGEFDRTYDTAASPLVSPDQSKAAVTQLFYTTNWLHDYWYNSGFTETAGNAQESNYGRGGEEGDSLNAQAQDKAIGIMPGNVGAARNNANMSTPRDGEHPRMQMFLWSGQNDLNLDIGAPISSSYAAGSAAFGPQNFDVTAELVLANDNTLEPPNPTTAGTLTDACSPLVNNVTGKIVLVTLLT
ncbi:MAG TPA: M36 family metallopeptidase, partial [Polyangium sp.]|nr:M36 family metallopeptidase [Polyangium sp.]